MVTTVTNKLHDNGNTVQPNVHFNLYIRRIYTRAWKQNSHYVPQPQPNKCTFNRCL